jgi:hypothetical protein
LVNEIISKRIQASDQLDNLFDASLRRFGYSNNTHAQYVIQKLRNDLHLFQNPCLALATINSYEMVQSSATQRLETFETISALSSHSSTFAAEPRTLFRTPTGGKDMLETASGQKFVRASSASRAAQVLAQRFNLK